MMAPSKPPNAIQPVRLDEKFHPTLNTSFSDLRIQNVILENPIVRALIVPECDLQARRRCMTLLSKILLAASPVLQSIELFNYQPSSMDNITQLDQSSPSASSNNSSKPSNPASTAPEGPNFNNSQHFTHKAHVSLDSPFSNLSYLSSAPGGKTKVGRTASTSSLNKPLLPPGLSGSMNPAGNSPTNQSTTFAPAAHNGSHSSAHDFDSAKTPQGTNINSNNSTTPHYQPNNKPTVSKNSPKALIEQYNHILSLISKANPNNTLVLFWLGHHLQNLEKEISVLCPHLPLPPKPILRKSPANSTNSSTTNSNGNNNNNNNGNNNNESSKKDASANSNSNAFDQLINTNNKSPLDISPALSLMSTKTLYQKIDHAKRIIQDLSDRVQGAVCMVFWESWDSVYENIAEIVGSDVIASIENGRIFRPSGNAALYINRKKILQREMELKKQRMMKAQERKKSLADFNQMSDPAKSDSYIDGSTDKDPLSPVLNFPDNSYYEPLINGKFRLNMRDNPHLSQISIPSFNATAKSSEPPLKPVSFSIKSPSSSSSSGDSEYNNSNDSTSDQSARNFNKSPSNDSKLNDDHTTEDDDNWPFKFSTAPEINSKPKIVPRKESVSPNKANKSNNSSRQKKEETNKRNVLFDNNVDLEDLLFQQMTSHHNKASGNSSNSNSNISHNGIENKKQTGNAVENNFIGDYGPHSLDNFMGGKMRNYLSPTFVGPDAQQNRDKKKRSVSSIVSDNNDSDAMLEAELFGPVSASPSKSPNTPDTPSTVINNEKSESNKKPEVTENKGISIKPNFSETKDRRSSKESMASPNLSENASSPLKGKFNTAMNRRNSSMKRKFSYTEEAVLRMANQLNNNESSIIISAGNSPVANIQSPGVASMSSSTSPPALFKSDDGKNDKCSDLRKRIRLMEEEEDLRRRKSIIDVSSPIPDDQSQRDVKSIHSNNNKNQNIKGSSNGTPNNSHSINHNDLAKHAFNIASFLFNSSSYGKNLMNLQNNLNGNSSSSSSNDNNNNNKNKQNNYSTTSRNASFLSQNSGNGSFSNGPFNLNDSDWNLNNINSTPSNTIVKAPMTFNDDDFVIGCSSNETNSTNNTTGNPISHTDFNTPAEASNANNGLFFDFDGVHW